MAPGTVTPIDSERPFGFDELFFSTTSPKGIIRTGNRVFERVAGFGPGELTGRPHNVIRHPDMPRAAFQLLWQYLESGRPIAAYVKNMAVDGSYYWVLATVVPFDGGYLSVRIKPSTAYFDAVRGVYAEVRAAEQAAEAAGVPRKEAVEASSLLLHELVAAAGFSGYDELMHVAAAAELHSRDAHIAGRRTVAALGAGARSGAASGDARAALVDIHRSLSVLLAFLDARFARLDDYVALNQKLASKSAFVLDLADGIRLASINAIVAAARLRDEGAALGVVADMMRSRSHGTAALVRSLTDDIAGAVDLLHSLGFTITLARLQAEMATAFVEEMLDERGAPAEAAGEGVQTLAGCIGASLDSLLGSLAALDGRLGRIAGDVSGLRELLKVLDALQTSGRIEASRMGSASAFVQLFLGVRNQIVEAQRQLADFADGRTAADAGAGREADALHAEIRTIAARSSALRSLAA